MLRHGVPLDQIGLVLRHRSIDMSAYYAKVDVALLQQIAQPWPGVHLMIDAVEAYLAVRRAAGFTLSNTDVPAAQLCALRRGSSGSAYPHGNGYRLGQCERIGCAAAHPIPNRLPVR